MEYAPMSIAPVRSITQRALLSYWLEASGDKLFPSIEEFRPEQRVHDPKQLVFWKIERLGPSQRCFRALFQGDHVTDAFGAAWAGQTMDAVVPEFARPLALEAANECATTGCAVYTIVTTLDAQGERLDCERLLLPLGRHGIVEQMVASLQLISLAGRLGRRTAVSSFEARAEVSFAGKLKAPAHRASTRADEPGGWA